jgi:hypothetical protein
LEVVAPPISSGMLKPWRSISLGDVDHLVQRRGDEAGEADDVHVVLPAFCRICSAGTITPRSMTS